MTFLTVPRFSISLSVNKADAGIINQLIKKIDDEMILLGGKWNGHNGYDFKTPESANTAKDRMKTFENQFQQLTVNSPINVLAPSLRNKRSTKACCPGG